VQKIIARFLQDPEGGPSEVIAECGGVFTGVWIPQLLMCEITVPEGGDQDLIIQKLNDHPAIKTAFREPVMVRKDLVAYNSATNDTLFEISGSAYRRTNVLNAWKYTKGTGSIKFCVIDTGVVLNGGVNPYHVDLPPAEESDFDGYNDWGWNDSFFNGYAPYSHGTNIWSTLKAYQNNGAYYAGLVPDCPGVFLINVNEEYGTSYAISVQKMYTALSLSCKLINASWGWYDSADGPAYDAMRSASADIWNSGSILFAAGGNNMYDHDDWFVIPNEFPNVLNVGGCTTYPGAAPDDPYVSDWGAPINLVAPLFFPMASVANQMPGGNGAINLTSGSYFGGGTSFASPFAMGCAALIWSINPSLTNQQVVAILTSTVSPGRYSTWNTKYPNAGVVNAGKGVAKARATLPSNSGVPIPYLGFVADDNREMTTIVSGTATTTLTGTVYLDIAGFCDEPVTSVALYLGSDLIYSGSNTLLTVTASNAGAPQQLKVIARTATTSSEETYSDIIVSSFSGVESPEVVFSSETSQVYSSADVYYVAQNPMMGSSFMAGPYEYIDTPQDYVILDTRYGILQSADYQGVWDDVQSLAQNFSFGAVQSYYGPNFGETSLTNQIAFNSYHGYIEPIHETASFETLFEFNAEGKFYEPIEFGSASLYQGFGFNASSIYHGFSPPTGGLSSVPATWAYSTTAPQAVAAVASVQNRSPEAPGGGAVSQNASPQPPIGWATEE
jgi:hypothetical protein